MTTDRSVRKYIITTLLVLTGIMGLSVHSAANAFPQTGYERIDAAVVAVRCGILGAAKGIDQPTLQVYMNIVKDYVEHPEVAYEAGYTVGMLDAYGHANNAKVGSYTVARLEAATYMYKALGCKANVSI